MILTKNAILDGQVSFERGVDTYRAPSRVPRNQLCLLINNTTRQDYIGTRPGWKQIPLEFVSYDYQYGYSEDTTGKTLFETGFFQGMSGYVPDAGPSSLVFSISGQIFNVDPFSGTAQQVRLNDGSLPDNPARRPIAWFAQGECFLVIQDGQSIPLIWDGSSLRKADTLGIGGVDADGRPLNEIPVGTCMAYSGGRFWVAIDDGMHFVASDGVYGPTGTAAYNQRDSILKFTENNYLAGGFPFPVPQNMGQIRAIVPLANLDTSLGQGPLQIFTTYGCLSVQAPFDRTLWAAMTDPIRTISLLDQGALSQRGCALVNGDVWYRAQDGVRSFMIARRDFGTWGNRAMSYEVIRHLKDDDRALLDRQSAALFDNRLLCTCAPQWDPNHGVYHRGLVVLDFIPLTSMAGSEPPCWDGLWTGKDILQVTTVQSEGVDHCYAAVLGLPDAYGQRRIELWELTLDDGVDTSIAGEARITRAIETPKLDFGSKVEQKLLEACELWIDKLRGSVDISLYYRPNEHGCWYFWKNWTVCAKSKRCAGESEGGCMPSLNLREQFRARMGAQRPPDNTVPGTGEPSRLGYTFQIRLQITGDCEVMTLRFMANRVVEPAFAVPTTAICEEVICCEPNDFDSTQSPDGGGISTGPVGIVEEVEQPWIGLENQTTIIRTEDQPQYPGNNPGTTPVGGGGGTGPAPTPSPLPDPAPVPDPVPDIPTIPGPDWPVLPDYGCPGEMVRGALSVYDPIRGENNFVGVPDSMASPEAYIAANGQPGCKEAWALACWQEFLAAGIPYSQARVEWVYAPSTSLDFLGTQVFPDQPGNYPKTPGPWKMQVRYCPL